MTQHNRENQLTTDEFSARFSRELDNFQRYARTLAGDTSLAEDVVGDVFLNLTDALRRGAGITASNFDVYVRAAIRNQAVSSWRKHQREHVVEDVVVLADRKVPVPTPEVDEPTWSAAALREAFADLPTRSQQVLYLREVEQRKFPQIGAALGLSESTAYVVAHRAREALRVSYLVHATAESAVCGRVDRGHLAAYVRGRAPERRATMVREHLADCSQCAAAVERMRNMRLPAGALALAGLPFPAIVATTRPGVELQESSAARMPVAGAGSAPGRVWPGFSWVTPGIAALAAGILLVGGVAVVAATLTGDDRPDSAAESSEWNPSASAGTSESGETTQTGESSQTGETTQTSESGETSRLDGGGTETASGDIIADLAVPPAGGEPVCPSDPSRPADGSAPLVNGVEWGCAGAPLLAATTNEVPAAASVAWAEPSRPFLLGQPNSPIALTVQHPGGDAAYRLEIVAGSHIRLSTLPAGCALADGIVGCVPSAAQRAASSYTLTFSATVLAGQDSRLPRVDVRAG